MDGDDRQAGAIGCKVPPPGLCPGRAAERRPNGDGERVPARSQPVELRWILDEGGGERLAASDRSKTAVLAMGAQWLGSHSLFLHSLFLRHRSFIGCARKNLEDPGRVAELLVENGVWPVGFAIIGTTRTRHSQYHYYAEPDSDSQDTQRQRQLSGAARRKI
jgi:hypothetical protein